MKLMNWTATVTAAAAVIVLNACGHTLLPQETAAYSPSPMLAGRMLADQQAPMVSGDSYSKINENNFKQTSDQPLSTFSIDVDRASYANVRRLLDDGRLPPKDAVRVEEFVNYFSYDYPAPTDGQPIAVYSEVSTSPYHPQRQLMKIGLQAERMDLSDAPRSNLVFLLDVSGSMHGADRLGLVKSALKLLVNNLDDDDRVSIVVYAGAAGTVLEPTPGNAKQEILDAINRLSAGGSTAGAAGIKLAYQLAEEEFIAGGNNRVILATDGDFNVGVSSESALEDLIVEQREKGIFLTVLGVGRGNFQDSKMEVLADKGNGNYAYLDSVREAKKVLVNEVGGTLFTVAKDVKLQIEFNPLYVQAYRLIGYENRVLNNEDFNDDGKDAGELGAGHTVTALYEIIPVGADETQNSNIDSLRYQYGKPTAAASDSGEMALIKVRYKEPDEDLSELISLPVKQQVKDIGEASADMRFASAVAGFGMLLRDSEHKGEFSYAKAMELASGAFGQDRGGYRRELVELIELAEGLQE